MANEHTETEARQRWLGVLARARPDELGAAWARLPDPPEMVILRAPEIGLVMARGRAGGTGQRFNLGEVTVTRCSVQSGAGFVGHGYVRGRSKTHALLVARFDALCQDPDRRPALMAEVVVPLAAAETARRAAIARKAAATRVEFFTLVRGED